MKLRYIIVGTLLILLSVNANLVYGQASGNTGTPGVVTGNTGTPASSQPIPALHNPLKAKSLTDFLYTIMDFAVFIGVILAVFMFIYIGFKFVLAQGDPTKLKEARDWFLWAVVGTAILISSKVIVDVIKSTSIQAGIVDPNAFNKPNI